MNGGAGARIFVCALLLGVGGWGGSRAFAQQPAATGASPALSRQIRNLISRGAANRAYWGIQVVRLKDGKKLVGINDDKLFTPASTAKLFTAAAALERLGPDFRYRTTIETSAPVTGEEVAGDITLVGRGDPNLSGRLLPYQARTERVEPAMHIFQDLAAQVAARGIRKISGNLIVDDTYFVAEPHGVGWAIDDVQWGYGAPVSALAINDNVAVLHILPGPVVGAPATITMEPLDGYYHLDNRVVTVSPREQTAGGGDAAAVESLGMDRAPGSDVLHVWGAIRQDNPGWTRAVSVEDPARLAGEFFKQELARQGIEVVGGVAVLRIQRFEVPDLRGAAAPIHEPHAAATTILASQDSAPLDQSLQVILKVSQNLHAEMLLRTLGRVRRNIGSAEAGLEEVRNFLAEQQIAPEDVILKDGSGLSRQDLVTPAAMVSLLRTMQRSPRADTWMSLLPVAGQDGSLAERLKGRTVAGRVWAKTGTLSGIAALAGYVKNQGNQLIAFALFVNQHDMPNGDAVALLDRIVELIARTK